MIKLLVAALIIILIAGCVQTAATGSLQIKITDAVQSLTALKLTINTIELHKALDNKTADKDINTPTEGEEVNESSPGWISVSVDKTFDLITVKDIKEILGDYNLEIGKYTQIRLSITSAKATINDIDYDLNVPSGKIRFIHPFSIEENKTTSLVIDFDADKSVVSAGDKYILKPVVKVLTEFKGKTKEEANKIKQEQEAEKTAKKTEIKMEIIENIAHVEIINYAFVPKEITIKKGTTVIWTNKDRVSHTVSSAHLERTSGTMRPNESWNITFDKEGTYNYYCAFYPSIKGKIVVE